MSESQIIIPQPVSEVIDGLEFTTVQFPAFYALGLLPRVGRLGSAFGAGGGEGGAPLDPGEMQALVLELLRQTSVWLDDGKSKRKIEINTQAKFDQVFTGRLVTAMKVVEFASKVNFDSFVDGSVSAPAAQQLPAE